MAKKAEIQRQLQDKKNLALKRDIDLLETTQGQRRLVYEWYAVPYWIARHMIDSNEVVLSWRDCYWWGRTDLNTPVIRLLPVIELFVQVGMPP